MSTADNERRIDRMDTWISHAEKASGESDAHLRFLFYWIAYEAAYQTDSEDEEHWKAREDLHWKLTSRDRGRLQSILHAQKHNIVQILELRQAHPSFWYEGAKVNAGVATPGEWGSAFRNRVRLARERLTTAVRSGVKKDISTTLNYLFKNLNLVRNQIVHGASAGAHSRGRTQVIAGAALLNAFIPCIRDSIEFNIDEDWGKPPFPRVGEGPDDECPPPWMS